MEVRGHQIDDGSEVFDGATTTSLAFDRLDDAVESLRYPVGDASPAVGDDPIPMGADGLGDLLHLRNLRTCDPTTPPLKVALGVVGIGLLQEPSLRIRETKGLAGFKSSAAHLTPDLLLFHGQPVLTLEFLRELPMFASAALAQGLSDQLHHVEVVEHQQRSTELLGDSLHVGRAHVRSDRLDPLGGKPHPFEVVENSREVLLSRPPRRKLRGSEVVMFGLAHDGQLFLPSPAPHLVDADNSHLAEVHGLLSLGNVMEQNGPNSLGILPKYSSHLGNSHTALGKTQNHGLHQQGESALGASPRDRDVADADEGTTPTRGTKAFT